MVDSPLAELFCYNPLESEPDSLPMIVAEQWPDGSAQVTNHEGRYLGDLFHHLTPMRLYSTYPDGFRLRCERNEKIRKREIAQIDELVGLALAAFPLNQNSVMTNGQRTSHCYAQAFSIVEARQKSIHDWHVRNREIKERYGRVRLPDGTDLRLPFTRDVKSGYWTVHNKFSHELPLEMRDFEFAETEIRFDDFSRVDNT